MRMMLGCVSRQCTSISRCSCGLTSSRRMAAFSMTLMTTTRLVRRWRALYTLPNMPCPSGFLLMSKSSRLRRGPHARRDSTVAG